MDVEESTFEDGNISAVSRIGNTVRRAPGFWTPAVHTVLHYLEDHGFTHAPKVLGFDEKGREILSYLEGRTAPASLLGFQSDSVLVAVARLLRHYHDAVSGFQPPSDALWQTQVGAPREGDIICHNDIAPWNTVFSGEQPIAFLDWDYAAPGPRIWDVAHALWRYVPLYAVEQVSGSLTGQVHRIGIFCKAYGLSDGHGLLEAIERRQQALYDTVVEQAEAGMPSFVKLWNDGHAALVMNDITYLQHNRAAIEVLLSRAF